MITIETIKEKKLWSLKQIREWSRRFIHWVTQFLCSEIHFYSFPRLPVTVISFLHHLFHKLFSNTRLSGWEQGGTLLFDSFKYFSSVPFLIINIFFFWLHKDRAQTWKTANTKYLWAHRNLFLISLFLCLMHKCKGFSFIQPENLS